MSTKVLLSPSETKLAEKLGDEAITSPLPEEKGADILIYTENGLLGIQRKEVPNDFLSSFTDGRMARALPLLTQSCKFSRLVCEGSFKYWPDGTVHLGMQRGGKRVPSRFTRKHIHGMINDIEFVRGILVKHTDDLDDTILYIKSVREFLSGKRHTGLFSRPSVRGNWYVPTSKEIDLWILQSFPGIGPSLADAIIMQLGSIPLRWTCTLEDLSPIPKLTEAKAKEMLSCSSIGSGIDKNAPPRALLDSLRERLQR